VWFQRTDRCIARGIENRGTIKHSPEDFLSGEGVYFEFLRIDDPQILETCRRGFGTWPLLFAAEQRRIEFPKLSTLALASAVENSVLNTESLLGLTESQLQYLGRDNLLSAGRFANVNSKRTSRYDLGISPDVVDRVFLV